MFRRRRRPTPQFKIPPPYNPIQGENANLRQGGVSPFCAMMQVAAEDVWDNYVICRGFDPRILKFIDYAEGDPNKPGICVAKPFGNRTAGTYQVAEIYPAFLPTQGNAGFADFRQVTYVPPSPTTVDWRVGQNPGVVTGGQSGGQPQTLSDSVGILIDHNGKAVNWLLVDNRSGPIDYFILAEDASQSTRAYIYAWKADINEVTSAINIELIDGAGTMFKLFHWESILRVAKYAKAGYGGICEKDRKNRMTFVDGPCIDGCQANGTIDLASIPEGVRGTAYSHTITGTNIDETTIDLSGLPDGLSYDAGTQTISGTPTESGTFVLIITAVSDNACDITNAFELVITEPA